MKKDRIFLLEAVKMAEEGVKRGGGPFGAVVVKDEKVLVKEFNRVVLNSDPTAHAEVLAIRKMSEMLNTHNLEGCVLYSSCEPCPMCLGAIYWSGIKRVVYSSDRAGAEDAGFSDRFIYDEISAEPAERKVEFVNIPLPESKLVFNHWKSAEDKIPY
jgi:tRNA(Arg) A34 adenosine deaminase TadA